MTREARRQVAALPIRRCPDGTWQVLLVTSRETGRWIIPKGWLEREKRPHAQAALEAFEEAGVEGEIGREPIGSYRYDKHFRGRKKTRTVECEVTVYPLKVERQRPSWPERDQRSTSWFAPGEAAKLVDEAGLAMILLGVADKLA